jgi:hypothetical protein
MISFAISLFNGFYQVVPVWKLILYFCLSFVSSAVIKGTYFIFVVVLAYVSQKYQIKSYIIILLLFIVIVSLIVFLPFQYVKMKADFSQFNQFGELC